MSLKSGEGDMVEAAVPELPLTVSTASDKSAEEDAKRLVKHIRPHWNVVDMKAKHFSDGITNKLLGVYTREVGAGSGMVLVRVFGEATELLVDRAAERRNMLALHDAGGAGGGLCPPLLAGFTNGIVYGFAPGQCVTHVTVREDGVRRLIAARMSKMHTVSIDGEPREPCLFKKLRRYLQLAPDKLDDPSNDDRLRAQTPSKEVLSREVDALETALIKLDSPVVLCHNDLLLNNIVYNKEEDSVTFIDYEYGAYNYQAYDIGNHFAEYAGVDKLDFARYPGRDYQLSWLRHYLSCWYADSGHADRPVTEHDVQVLYVQANKFALVAHLFWGLWALIQQKYSKIDFDFLGYGILKLNEYKARKSEFLSLEIPPAT